MPGRKHILVLFALAPAWPIACAPSAQPAPAAQDPALLTTPVLPGAFAASRPGVDVSWWVSSPDPDRARDALAALQLGSAVIDPLAADAWRRAGLLLTPLRTADAPALLAALNPAPATGAPTPTIRRVFLPAGPRWAEWFRGTATDRPSVIGLHDSRLRLAPGTPRILGRSWLVPQPLAEPAPGGATQALRFQIVPQWFDPPPPRPLAITPEQLIPPAAPNQGLVFGRLLLTVQLEPGTALLVHAAPPPTSATDRPGDPPARPGTVLLDQDPPRDRARGLGPQLPADAQPTPLGQALLSRADQPRPQPDPTPATPRAFVLIVPWGSSPQRQPAP